MKIFSQKRKYYAVFCIREVNVQTIISVKKINPTNKTVKYKNNSFPIDITTPSYTKGIKAYFFFSLSDKSQLNFNNDKKANINTELIDSVMSQKIIEQLTKNLNNDLKLNLMTLLMGAIIGALGGYIYGQYSITQSTETSGLLMNLIGGLL